MSPAKGDNHPVYLANTTILEIEKDYLDNSYCCDLFLTTINITIHFQDQSYLACLKIVLFFHLHVFVFLDQICQAGVVAANFSAKSCHDGMNTTLKPEIQVRNLLLFFLKKI